MRAKFYQLGVSLDISADTLDVFAQDKIDNAFIEVIKTWMNGVTPTPTWKAMIRTLRMQSVDERALANKIAEKYCPGEVEAEVDSGGNNNPA